jgi:hypothetical protein
VNVFIGPLIHRLVSANNYTVSANLHNSQITTAPAKHFTACYVLTGRSLATASNIRESSVSRAQVLSSQVDSKGGGV